MRRIANQEMRLGSVKRQLVRTFCAIALCLSGARPAAAAIGPLPGGNIRISLDTVASWEPSYPSFSPGASTQSGNYELAPTEMHPLNDGTGRHIVSTLGGTIRMLDGNFNLLPT